MNEIDINQENPFNVDTATLDEMQEEAERRVSEMFINGEIDIIDEFKHDLQYYKQIDKKYKKRFNKLIRSALKYWNKPYEYYFEFELLLKEMEFVRYQPKEYLDNQRMRLIKEMNMPLEFKLQIEESIENIKVKGKKAINKFKRS